MKAYAVAKILVTFYPEKRYLSVKYPHLISVAVINTIIKSKLGRKGLIWFPYPVSGISLREVRAGTEARREQTAASYLPTIHSLCLFRNHAHLLRGGTAHSGLCPSTSTINQENGPQICPPVNLMDTFSQLRVLFPVSKLTQN